MCFWIQYSNIGDPINLDALKFFLLFRWENEWVFCFQHMTSVSLLLSGREYGITYLCVRYREDIHLVAWKIPGMTLNVIQFVIWKIINAIKILWNLKTDVAIDILYVCYLLAVRKDNIGAKRRTHDSPDQFHRSPENFHEFKLILVWLLVSNGLIEYPIPGTLMNFSFPFK